jgi:patatin-related protein
MVVLSPMAHPRELRLAVAMRGGVSLAVYMGGVCSELARMRASTVSDHTADDAYASWLAAAGFDDVVVDVIAGTSAGGLNGVLLASHLVYGMEFGSNVRDMWLQLGDLERLTRNPRHLAVESLLDGDHYFYEKLRETLETFTPASSSTPPDGERSIPTSALRLILTATRVAPRADAVRPALGPTLSTGARRAHFRFRHAPDQAARWPGDTLSDFATSDGLADSLRCLAYAGRTTSSFPGAFEPARPIVATRNAQGDPYPPLRRNELAIDMSGVCSEAGAPEPGLQGRVEMIDGGLLDNIPLAWAVRAIASSPAAAPVDRWLLYLQPVPPRRPQAGGPSESARARPLSRLAGVIIKSFSIWAGSESLLEDEAELRDAAARGARARAADGSVLALCRDRAPETIVNAAMLDQYVRCANTLDGVRFAYLVERPVDALGGDPLPFPAATNVLAALDETDAGGRFLGACRKVESMAFATTPSSSIDIVEQGRSPIAIVRACMSLLGWIRLLETDGGATVDTSLRDDLYSTRLAAETLVAVRDRMLLSTSAARLRPSFLTAHPARAQPDVIARDVDHELASHLGGIGSPAADADAAEWRNFANVLAATVVHHAARTDPLSSEVATQTEQSTEPQASTANPAIAALWKRVAYLASRLAAHAAPAQSVGLANVLPLDTTDALGRVVAYEILAGPLRPDPLAEATPIRVAAITAANASPLERLIFPGETLDDAARVDRKLSGNQVANFAAFLSSRWRDADWIWGRLDAAQSLASIIAARLPDTTTRNDIQRLCFAGASDVVQPTLAQVLADLHIDDANAVSLAPVALAARLHLDILEQELPVLARLQERTDGSDLPPDGGTLRVEPFATAADLEHAAPTLAAVGAETLWTLAGRTDLRRTIVRAGLVGWEALQPSGGIAAALARIVLLLLKPFAVAALVAYVAPSSGIVAAAASYLVAAIIAGHWFSWLAYVFAAGGALLVVAGTVQRRLGRDARASSRRVLWWIAVAVAAVALGVLGYFLHDRTGPVEWSTGRAVASVAVLEFFGAGLPLRWLSGRRHSGRFVSRALRILAAVVAATAAAALTCWIVYSNDVPMWFAALLGVWAPLAAVTAVLMLAYPPSNEPTTETAPTGHS